MPSANDDEQNIDNHITKYLELNKDSMLDLAERHSENLAEALTNNAIDTAASSSNPALSLPQSSLTFPRSSNQSDINRIKEPESFRNSKGDIVD